MRLFSRPMIAGLVAAGGAAVLLTGGCGIATAPLSVPDAIAQNANFSFKGDVRDAGGRPLTGVLMSQQLDHHFWTPIAGGTETDEHRLRRVDGGFDVEERGRELNLTFTHDGYYDVSYTINSSDAKSVRTEHGYWPIVQDFPVVMLSRTPADARLNTWDEILDYAAYPRQPAMDLGKPNTGRLMTINGSPETMAALPSGVFYLTMMREPPRATNAQGDVDPVTVNLPGNVALHVAGPQNGLQHIEARIGYPPIQTCDLAPESGYGPSVEIGRSRLQEMRLAESDRIMEAHDYFFLRANDHYGKGMISWSRQFTAQDSGTPPLSFRIQLWMQPAAGDRNLQTHGVECTCK